MMSLAFKTYAPKLKQLTKELHGINISFHEHDKNSVDLRNQHMDDCVKQAIRDDPKSKAPTIIKQLKHIEEQRRDALCVNKTLKGSREGALSYILIPAVSEYSDSQQADPSFNYKNIHTMWARITPSNGKNISNWEIVDQQHEVEHLTLECMKLHFMQSNNTPLTSDFWIKNLMDPATQKSILNGTFDFSSYPHAMQTYFQALHIDHSTPTLDFNCPLKDFEQFIKKSCEETSASPSGRHYGHFKVILKYLPNVFRDIHNI